MRDTKGSSSWWLAIFQHLSLTLGYFHSLKLILKKISRKKKKIIVLYLLMY